MEIYEDFQNISLKNPIITIGTFDGIHLGHHIVIERLKKIAAKQNGKSVILTFRPHPRIVLNPENKNLRLLNSFPEKVEQLSKLGIDYLLVQEFTKEFSRLSYIDFVEQVLVNQLKIKTLLMGYDNKFGYGRKGDYQQMLELAKKYDFLIIREKALNAYEETISSTKIRKALIEEGNIEKAKKYLGYSFRIQGTVIEGNKNGRKIGFPTANIQLDDDNKLIPKTGVYAVKGRLKDKLFSGMLNIGFRPTVSELNQLSVEVNIFDFDKNIYGDKIVVQLFHRIRNEKKFKNLEMLRKQLMKDKSYTRKYFEKNQQYI